MKKNNEFISLGDYNDSNIEKAYNPAPVFDIEKSAHKDHKYLKIEDGKYIYDYSKMTSKDHIEASEFHKNEAERWKKGFKQTSSEVYKHEKLAKEHDALSYKKESEERKKIKAETEKQDDKTLNDKLKKSSDSNLTADQHKNEMKKHEEKFYNYSQKGNKDKAYEHQQLALHHKAMMRDKIKPDREKGMIQKSEAFNTLIPKDFDDKIK